MKEGPDIAGIAALIGDPARANMLSALMSGKALTASELAEEAGITLQTASSHLSKLHEGGLVQPRKQGRHKYFSLANDDVARVLEGLMGLAAGTGQLRSRRGPRDPALRKARICYNHLAGDRGVQLFDSLIHRDFLRAEGEALALSCDGRAFVTGFGIDVGRLESAAKPLCRACLDWSERRSHLAGSLGRAFLARFEDMGWLTVQKSLRIVRFSPAGETAFASSFPLAAA
ncbi:MAG: winged helix-turn-helix transcriptional regulator [Rhodospirillales bacterium]|nr:winged helix-turn-helix transcriptional regulator [Rhodospirillales bacterium]